MSRRPVVLAVIQRVLEDKGLPTEVGDDEVAMDGTGLGLDSLDIATIVAELQDELGVDPFAQGDVQMGTLGDFVALYET